MPGRRGGAANRDPSSHSSHARQNLWLPEDPIHPQGTNRDPSSHSSLGIPNLWLTVDPCAADFSLLHLPKGKSLGRSKPATSSYAQAPQHTVWV